MLKTYLISIVTSFILASTINAEIAVTVIKSSGNVKVRYGLDEKWQPLALGNILKDIDTILTGEQSEAVLKLESGTTFKLGSNAVLDIGDLRKIYEKELFLYLMSKKVENMEPRYEKTPLRIGNVSVVHGESKKIKDTGTFLQGEQDWAEWELNGAIDLQDQAYHPNAIIKLHTILDKYPETIDMGKVYFYIAQSFEALNMYGQAIDAFEVVIDAYSQETKINEEKKVRLAASEKAVERLKSQY